MAEEQAKHPKLPQLSLKDNQAVLLTERQASFFVFLSSTSKNNLIFYFIFSMKSTLYCGVVAIVKLGTTTINIIFLIALVIYGKASVHGEATSYLTGEAASYLTGADKIWT